MVERGILPGKQDNFREELYAAYVAVQCAEAATLFSGNLAVVLGFRFCFPRVGYSCFLQQAETALWWELWRCLAPKRERWRVCHVKSHTKTQKHESFAQKWAWHHNATADETAKGTHALRSAELCEAASAADKAYASTVCAAKCVLALQEAIVRARRRPRQKPVKLARLLHLLERRLSSRPTSWCNRGAVPNVNFQPHDFPDTLLRPGPRFMWVVQARMLQGPWVQTSEWISVLALYVHFVASTGWRESKQPFSCGQSA